MTLACSPFASASQPMFDPQGPDAPGGGARLATVDGRSLPLVSAKLRVIAGAGLARVVLEQTFENPYEDTLRVHYKMPLPVKGAVSGYVFRIGARTITGKVDRKESARTRFEEAVANGHTAALLEQDKADIFTQQIGNIPARQTIVAEITIDQQLAWTPEGEWELRFPTVIGPRYIGANVTPEDARASHVELADGGVRARLHLEMTIADAITEGRKAASPTHRISERPDGSLELLSRAGEKLDRDIVVRWPVSARTLGVSLRTARPAAGSPNAHGAYALLSIVPPTPDAGHKTIPRDVIVLLDTSGSMSGPPLEQGKRVVASFIDSLTDQDQLEVIEFSNRPNRYGKGPVAATAREKQNAITWVMARQASGGTEMLSAIMDALRGLRKGAQRQVVLVTDGYVGGEEQIVTLLHESLPESCRMHVVGVGSAVNRTLAVSLARAGRGVEVLVGLDEDAERSAKHLIDRTKSPVLTDLSVSGDVVLAHAPEHLPDVFAGAPLVAALQVLPSGGEIVVRGKLAGGDWEQRITVPGIPTGQGDESVSKLFARERVADLEMRWTIGTDVRVIDREIESIGMVFQIATRRTSWLAIDDDRTVDPTRGSREETIPQELPYGTTMASYGAPLMAGALAAPMRAASMAFAVPAPAPMSFASARSMAPPGAPKMAPPPARGMAPPPMAPPSRSTASSPRSTPLPRPASGGPPTVHDDGREEERTERRVFTEAAAPEADDDEARTMARSSRYEAQPAPAPAPAPAPLGGAAPLGASTPQAEPARPRAIEPQAEVAWSLAQPSIDAPVAPPRKRRSLWLLALVAVLLLLIAIAVIVAWSLTR